MNIMMRELPNRCFDVGIAEGHAVTFSAGLAAAGSRPFCNIYSSFMQRAYDNVIHDVALQNLPVVMCLHRAGIVGEDGGDISLRYHGSIQLLSAIEQTGEVTGTGIILADGTEVILGYFDRGEEIPVVTEEGFAESKEGFCTIYLDGLYAWVRENLVCMEEAEPFEEWDGYARWSAVVYDNIHLIGTPKDKLNTNTKIHVVDELENCYLVEIEEVPGFMAKDMVSKWRYSSGSSDDEGGGGGGSGGGGVGGAEWTPPAL
jgi:uncharacterized membrane protein YgcG